MEHVRTRHMLIVLDNCEHVLEATARFVDAVLHATPRVHFLTTSREVLNLSLLNIIVGAVGDPWELNQAVSSRRPW